ncbi:MAG: Hsp20/alpha crystallin family protein [Bdellovibrionota bacterium]|nr:Hsp20/alpha crystallin family protein [Bdellovibrionota bacterium]
MSKILTSKVFSILSAFVVGGVSTYFATDYIRLKNNENISRVEKPAETSRFKVSQSQVLKQDDLNDPFAQMDKIHDQMQKRMNKVFGNSMLGSGMLGSSLFDNSFFDSNRFGGMTSDGLKVEEYEDDEFKYVEVIADGIDKNSININISDGMISISGEIRRTDDNQSTNSRSMSHFVSSFSRSFNIPRDVNEENVKIETEENKIVIKFPRSRRV